MCHAAQVPFLCVARQQEVVKQFFFGKFQHKTERHMLSLYERGGREKREGIRYL